MWLYWCLPGYFAKCDLHIVISTPSLCCAQLSYISGEWGGHISCQHNLPQGPYTDSYMVRWHGGRLYGAPIRIRAYIWWGGVAPIRYRSKLNIFSALQSVGLNRRVCQTSHQVAWLAFQGRTQPVCQFKIVGKPGEREGGGGSPGKIFHLEGQKRYFPASRAQKSHFFRGWGNDGGACMRGSDFQKNVTLVVTDRFQTNCSVYIIPIS